MSKITNVNKKVSKVTFTYHNYTVDTIKELELLIDNGKYKSIAYSKELGLGHSKHLQGFCTLKSSRRIGVILKDLKGAHVEVMKGSIKQNVYYCSKESELVVLGDSIELNMSSNKNVTKAQLYDLSKTFLPLSKLIDKYHLTNSQIQLYQTLVSIRGRKRLTKPLIY
jgi:hypothetical protein